MGIYKDLEYEFVERTLNLISQYESILHKFEFKEQYNYTLLINCLTGLIIMPKERTITAIPNDRLLSGMKKDMGLEHTVINAKFGTLRDFIIALRHCAAHFAIEVKSDHDGVSIGEIVFYDDRNGPRYEVAIFKATELLPFVRYYADWLKSNLKTAERNRVVKK